MTIGLLTTLIIKQIGIYNSVVYKDQVRKEPETNPLRYDEKFIQTCKDIGYSPKYQYQLLQMIIQVPEGKREVKEKFQNFC